MKKLLIAFAFLAIALTGFGQKISMFLPVPDDLFTSEVTIDRTFRGTLIWLPRWAAGVTASQLNFNKVTKKLEIGAFSKYGIGLSMAHYVEVDGLPYNNFSINGFLFIPTQNEIYNFSLGITASAFNFWGLNLQAGIDFEPGKIKSDYFPVAPLIGVKYNF